MATTITDLDEIPSTTVAENLEFLSAALQEEFPEIELKRGVLHDLLLLTSAVLASKNQIEQERLRRSMSLAEILLDPTLANDEVVDNIASNYRVERRPGATAGGAVTIVVSLLQDTTIAIGAEFVSNGKTFASNAAYTSRALDSDVISATDRRMIARDDGDFEFQIAVTAAAAGEASQLKKDTALTPTVPALSFVMAYASEDFIGGLNPDDNATLLDRFVNGMSAKVLSSRDNMSALLFEHFPDVIDDSIIGFGDPEMLRDRHSILPISMGGRVDWYIRTRGLYRTYGATKTATLVSLPGDGTSIWQMSFERDEFPGLYTVEVNSSSGNFVGSLPVIEDTRMADTTDFDDDRLVPDIALAIEAIYTRYQSVTVKFQDATKPIGGLLLGDTAEYRLNIRTMPELAEIQDFMSKRSRRNAASDVLIKAPMPCFVSLSFTVELSSEQPSVDSEAIADALAEFVNNYGFSGRLPASALTNIVHSGLFGRSAVTAIDMLGRLHYPDGGTRLLRSSELLVIPDEPTRMVSPRTAVFFLNPADVGISVVDAAASE